MLSLGGTAGMYVSGLGPTLRRHWPLSVAGLVLTLGLCFGAFNLIPPTFKATASVLILPSTSAVGEGGNPYLALGGLQPTADAISRAMADEEVVKSLRAAGARGDYTVVTDPTTGGPVLAVEVTADQRQATLTTLQLVLKRIPTTLTDLQQQAAVPPRFRLVSQVLSQDRVASPVLKGRIRGLAVAVALGVALTVSVVMLFDNVGRTRRRRAPVADDQPAPTGTNGYRAARSPVTGAARVANGAGVDDDTLQIRRPSSWPANVDEETTRLRTLP